MTLYSSRASAVAAIHSTSKRVSAATSSRATAARIATGVRSGIGITGSAPAGMLIAASRADAVAGVASGTPGRLSVSGTQILTPGGKPIVLRGFNWGQWGTAQSTDAASNVSQGANSVRIPLRWWGNAKPGVDSYNKERTRAHRSGAPQVA
jgi:hypothetical protein